MRRLLILALLVLLAWSAWRAGDRLRARLPGLARSAAAAANPTSPPTPRAEASVERTADEPEELARRISELEDQQRSLSETMDELESWLDRLSPERDELLARRRHNQREVALWREVLARADDLLAEGREEYVLSGHRYERQEIERDVERKRRMVEELEREGREIEARRQQLTARVKPWLTALENARAHQQKAARRLRELRDWEERLRAALTLERATRLFKRLDQALTDAERLSQDIELRVEISKRKAERFGDDSATGIHYSEEDSR